MPTPVRPIHERFGSKFTIDPKTGCWIWNCGLLQGSGYGQFWIAPSNRLAHRVAYELYVGPIPAGKQIDHLCRNRRCVNPAHLEPVTVRENVVVRGTGLSARNLRKTHCKRWHEFTPENTYPAGRNRKGRGCRTCLNEQARVRMRLYRAKKRAERDAALAALDQARQALLEGAAA